MCECTVVVIETVVMATCSVQRVTCGLLVVVVLSTMAMAESSAASDDAVDTAAAVQALVRALQHYRRPADVATKRETALDVDYGWGGGRFGKRRMVDRLGIAGRFGRSVDAVASRSASRTELVED